MKRNTSIHYLRNAVLALGALAVAPLTAQAMLMEQDKDTSQVEPGSSISADKRVSGATDDVLTRRFGLDSGIGANGSGDRGFGQVTDQASDGNTSSTGLRPDPVFMRAP